MWLEKRGEGGTHSFFLEGELREPRRNPLTVIQNREVCIR